EFVDGPTLRELMRSGGLPLAEALDVTLQICRGIDHAHRRGVIHRDLKPENILIAEGRIAKVTDFGLAGFAEGGQKDRFALTQTHVAMGTLSYMAPEQRADAKSADGRADLFSIGVILYELLVGDLPVGSYPKPSARRPELDPRLDAIIDRCLQPRPDDRYKTVGELIKELEPLAYTTSRPPPAMPQSQVVTAPGERSVVGRVAGGMFKLVFALAFVMMMGIV